MELQEFIEKFAEAVEIDEVSELKGDTEFKELDEWSSLAALSVIAMIDEDFDVSIGGRDIRGAKTLKDLLDFVESKK